MYEAAAPTALIMNRTREREGGGKSERKKWINVWLNQLHGVPTCVNFLIVSLHVGFRTPATTLIIIITLTISSFHSISLHRQYHHQILWQTKCDSNRLASPSSKSLKGVRVNQLILECNQLQIWSNRWKFEKNTSQYMDSNSYIDIFFWCCLVFFLKSKRPSNRRPRSIIHRLFIYFVMLLCLDPVRRLRVGDGAVINETLSPFNASQHWSIRRDYIHYLYSSCW